MFSSLELLYSASMLKDLKINKTHTGLLIEFILLCVVLPSIIIFNRLAPFMFFFLWAAAVYCGYHLFYRKHESFTQDVWVWRAVNMRNMRPIVLRWAFCVVGMLAFIYFYDPERMFSLVEHKPQFLLMLFIAYPLLSAFPQELIFCSFFFQRYKPFFPSMTARIIASAMVFAYAHILYINWVAPTLSFIAGLIFAHTYARTHSLALVTVEHGLYGNALFFIGLGWYFWGGSIVEGAQ